MKINNEKITRKFCENKILAFYPKTAGEAAMIQHHFIRMGFPWTNGNQEIAFTGDCVAHGIAIMNGKIYTTPHILSSLDNVYLCALEQFAENYISPAEMFNGISKRLDVLEDLLKPQKLDKPVFKKPDSTP